VLIVIGRMFVLFEAVAGLPFCCFCSWVICWVGVTAMVGWLTVGAAACGGFRILILRWGFSL